MNLITSSFSNAGLAADADRKETRAQAANTLAITPSGVRKFKDCSSPSLYPLFYRALDSVLDSYKSESDDGKGHNFDFRMLPLIASYEDEIIGEHFLSSIAFGKKMWNDWFGGDIGEAPPLPKDICSILAEPCPFNSGKTVAETQMLVLVPEKLNGAPMTLERLGELIKDLGKPSYKAGSYFAGYENTPFEASHWVLMTKDVIENSRSKSYEKQLELVQEHPNYRVLKLAEAATAIFVEYIATRIHLFNREPLTYTRCQENADYGQMVVGGFAPPGLLVDLSDHDYVNFGVAVARKF